VDLGRTAEPATEQTPINPIEHVAWLPGRSNWSSTPAASLSVPSSSGRPAVWRRDRRDLRLVRRGEQRPRPVVGDGNNRWPLVYDRDLADLYARLVAREDASGIYHANDEGDERVNDVVNAIKPHVKVKPDVRYVPIEEARHKMGAYADALALESGGTQSARPRDRMGAQSALGVGECRASAGRMAGC
jgi:hypothetical protein